MEKKLIYVMVIVICLLIWTCIYLLTNTTTIDKKIDVWRKIENIEAIIKRNIENCNLLLNDEKEFNAIKKELIELKIDYQKTFKKCSIDTENTETPSLLEALNDDTNNYELQQCQKEKSQCLSDNFILLKKFNGK